MKSFFSGLLNAALNSALKTAVSAGDAGAGLGNTGKAAGIGAIAGTLMFLLQHPSAQHPAVQAAATTGAGGINQAPAI